MAIGPGHFEYTTTFGSGSKTNFKWRHRMKCKRSSRGSSGDERWGIAERNLGPRFQGLTITDAIAVRPAAATVMTAEPADSARTKPVDDTAATCALLVDHW